MSQVVACFLNFCMIIILDIGETENVDLSILKSTTYRLETINVILKVEENVADVHSQIVKNFFNKCNAFVLTEI